jgi:isoleucyl-tRNA synthetase
MHRATPQWFADVGAIKEDAINALKDVHFKPESCEFEHTFSSPTLAQPIILQQRGSA